MHGTLTRPDIDFTRTGKHWMSPAAQVLLAAGCGGCWTQRGDAVALEPWQHLTFLHENVCSNKDMKCTCCAGAADGRAAAAAGHGGRCRETRALAARARAQHAAPGLQRAGPGCGWLRLPGRRCRFISTITVFILRVGCLSRGSFREGPHSAVGGQRAGAPLLASACQAGLSG